MTLRWEKKFNFNSTLQLFQMLSSMKPVFFPLIITHKLTSLRCFSLLSSSNFSPFHLARQQPRQPIQFEAKVERARNDLECKFLSTLQLIVLLPTLLCSSPRRRIINFNFPSFPERSRCCGASNTLRQIAKTRKYTNTALLPPL